LGLITVVALAALCLFGCRPWSGERTVVVYTSVDQVYAARIFDLFTERTGVRVRPVFDTEAAKTTGLYGRLLAERRRPRADVFWNNEICRTIQLADAGLADDLSVLVPDDIPRQWIDANGRWAGFSLRARIIVYNTDLVKADDAPRTLDDLAHPRWRDKVVMANPLFGTTAGHAAALYEALGHERAEALFRALKVNGVRLVEGNSAVRDVVARGEAPVGLTDTDDFFSGVRYGMPLGLALPDQAGVGTFVIPASVLLVAGGPNPQAARAFVRFLLQPEVEERLAFGPARQLPVRARVPRPDDLEALSHLRAMQVDYRRVAARLTEVAHRMEKIFLR